MNAELIATLRYCGNFANREGCDEECPYFNDKDCPKRIMCDAADALEADEAWEKAWTQKCERLEKRIAELEAQMPKQGKWISDLPNELFANVNPWKCSACGKHQHFREDYCPNCGAKMRKGEEK